MIDDYAKFVDMTTSDESKDMTALGHRLWQNDEKANWPRLLTAVIGMMSESGEFAEIVKKMKQVLEDGIDVNISDLTFA